MAFYYLHEHGKPVPEKDKERENGFKYLIHSKTTPPNIIEFSFEPGVFYCAHQAGTYKGAWNWDDEVIEVETPHNTIIASFKKVHDEFGVTVWKNQSLK